jgi:hypothetical protein
VPFPVMAVRQLGPLSRRVGRRLRSSQSGRMRRAKPRLDVRRVRAMPSLHRLLRHGSSQRRASGSPAR